MEDDGSALILLIPLVFVVIYLIAARRPRDRTALTVNASPKESVEDVVAYMAASGYLIAFHGETSATFTRAKKADVGIGCLLLLLGVVPGLLYFALAGSTQAVSVTAMRGDVGTSLILSGDDRNGLYELRDYIRSDLVQLDET